MKFITESGSIYEIVPGYVRRVNEKVSKRADGEWVPLYNEPEIEVGYSVLFLLEPLARYGPDDYGNRGGTTTVRQTSRVKEILQ